METWNRAGPPSLRVLLIIGGLLVSLVAGGIWWLAGADERRVNAACDTWLEHRDSLRTVLTESDEAVGRATAAQASSTVGYFNDLDLVRASLEQWLNTSQRVMNSLERGDDASGLERGAVSSFGFVGSGLTEFQGLLDGDEPAEVARWLPELAARFQNVDDVCLTAARSR